MTGSMKGQNIGQRLEYKSSPSETRNGEGYDRTESTRDQRCKGNVVDGEEGSRTPSGSVSLPRKGSKRKSREPGDLE